MQCIAGDPRAGLAPGPLPASQPHIAPECRRRAPPAPSSSIEPQSHGGPGRAGGPGLAQQARLGSGPSGWRRRHWQPGRRPRACQWSRPAAAGSARNRLALGMPWRLGSKAHNSTLPVAVVRRADEPHWQEPRISTLHCSKAHSGWQPLGHFHRAGRMRASTRVWLHAAGTKTTRHVRRHCETLITSLSTPSSSRPTHRGRRPGARAACRRYASSP